MVEGRRTSVKLDGFTWRCLHDICGHRNMTVHDFCTEVSRSKADYSGFTSALRIAILRHFRDMAMTTGSSVSRAVPSLGSVHNYTVGGAFRASPV